MYNRTLIFQIKYSTDGNSDDDVHTLPLPDTFEGSLPRTHDYLVPHNIDKGDNYQLLSPLTSQAELGDDPASPQPSTSTGIEHPFHRETSPTSPIATASTPASPVIPSIFDFMGVNRENACEEELDQVLEALRLQYHLECTEVERLKAAKRKDKRKINSEIEMLISLPQTDHELEVLEVLSQDDDDSDFEIAEPKRVFPLDPDWVPSFKVTIPPPSAPWATRLRSSRMNTPVPTPASTNQVTMGNGRYPVRDSPVRDGTFNFQHDTILTHHQHDPTDCRLCIHCETRTRLQSLQKKLFE